MTTLNDLDKEIREAGQALRDAERLIARDRRLNEPKNFRGGELEEFAAVSKQADRAYQASKIIPPPPADFESADMYRLRLATKMLPFAKLKSAEVDGLYRADTASTMAQKVFDAAERQAHFAPDLREVITEDRSGRKISEFIGSKKSWMSQFEGPMQVGPIVIDGVPQKLRTVY